MSNRAQFIVLCEDLQSQVFLCRALVHAGANPGRIRRVALPSVAGGGAGHSYVPERYPREVLAFRRQNASVRTGLVVHIDADPTHTVAHRHAQLAAALAKSGEAPRGVEEPIAELVPKRNIETWIHALDPSLSSSLKRPVDEVKAYPKLDRQSDCDRAAEAFADHARGRTAPAAAATIPSLMDGLDEFRRLP